MKKLIVVLLLLNLLATMSNLLDATKDSRKKYGLTEETNLMAWVGYFETRMDDELRMPGQRPLVLKRIVSGLILRLLQKEVINEKEWANIMGDAEEHDQ